MNNDTLILLSVLEDYKDKYTIGKLLKIIVSWVNCQLTHIDNSQDI